MKVLFLYPPEDLNPAYYTKKLHKFYSRKGVVLPPMGLSYLASVLKKEGHDVKIIDVAASELTKEQVISAIKEFNPKIVGLTIMTVNLYNILDWIKLIKENLGVKIVVGGPHIDIYPKETLSFKEIDYCVYGEGFITIKELVDAIENNKDINEVGGVCYRKEGEIVLNKARKNIDNFDDVPFPARELLPNKKYYTIISKRRPVGTMVTNFGCPFNCRYCTVSTKVRFMSPKRVVDEMEECVNKYGIGEILFYDATFTLDKKRTLEICEEIKRRKLEIIWSIRTRADCLDEELAREMASAGCFRVNIGIEAGDEQILKNIYRTMPLEQIKKSIYCCKKYKMSVFGFFMIGLPGDTIESIKRTINFAKELPLDFVQFNKFVPQPATQLYDEFVKETGDDPWQDFAIGKIKDVKIKQYKCDVSDEDLDILLKKAYKEFYFRTSYILRTFFNIRSFSEFKNLLKSAISII